MDLLPSLIDAGLIDAEQVEYLPDRRLDIKRGGSPSQLLVTPTVFRIPSCKPEPDLVAVMMPFDAAFGEIYLAIQGACTESGLRCLRVDDIWEDSTVIQDVFNLLCRSCIVVVDFTGRNPNVMYETGVAHTLGRMVIPMTQSLEHVPFDLRHHRVLQYLNNAEGVLLQLELDKCSV